MEVNCLCLLGADPCPACAELQAEFDKYCIEQYESYLWYKSEQEREAEPE